MSAWVAWKVFAGIHAALCVFSGPRIVPPAGAAVSLRLLGFEAQRIAP